MVFEILLILLELGSIMDVLSLSAAFSTRYRLKDMFCELMSG